MKKLLKRNIFKKSQNVSCNIKFNGIYRIMYFSDYTLDNECLINMLVDILINDTNYNENIDFWIYSLKLKNIFLVFKLKDKEQNYDNLIDNIFDYLENNKELTEPVDVIGDKFYYFFRGFKKLSELKHYILVDSAWGAAYDLFYSSKQHNNVTNLNFNRYEDFVTKIKTIINITDPFINVYNKNDNFDG